MNKFSSVGVAALLLAYSNLHADSPYPCTNNRCSLMQIDALACLGNGTTLNGWWGSACALGIGQYSCFSSPNWEQLLAIGGCSNINTVLPGFTSHPTSNHDWWASTGNRQRVDFGRDELHTEEIGLWVGSAYAEITGNFTNCDDLYAYLAANNGNWPTYTTQVGSGICENASWILDCGIAPCSRPPVLASSAHVSFDVSGTSLVAWIIRFSSPQIPFHQMGASNRVIYLLDASFIRPNGTRQRNIRTIDDNGGGSGGTWQPGWGPSVLYSPSGQSFTGVALISTAPTPKQLDFDGDGRLSLLDRWAQEATLTGTTLTMNLLLDSGWEWTIRLYGSSSLARFLELYAEQRYFGVFTS
jgi:hypothetical protein